MKNITKQIKKTLETLESYIKEDKENRKLTREIWNAFKERNIQTNRNKFDEGIKKQIKNFKTLIIFMT